jgi:DNA-binding MarR family transcriptional regulator
MKTPSSDMRSALDAFRRIVQALRAGGEIGHPGGVSSAQLFALAQIAEHPGVSINDLAALTFTHQSSVSIVVQRLVGRRLVAKVAARSDRRKQTLMITPAGRRVLQRAPVVVQEKLIAAISSLPVAERRRFSKSLAKIATAIAPEAGRHPPMLFEE